MKVDVTGAVVDCKNSKCRPFLSQNQWNRTKQPGTPVSAKKFLP